jgi:hypothetical protein
MQNSQFDPLLSTLLIGHSVLKTITRMTLLRQQYFFIYHKRSDYRFLFVKEGQMSEVRK